MKSVIYVCAAIVLAGVLAVSRTLADDKSSAKKVDPKTEELMKKAEALSKPGSAHKTLEPLVGNWTVEVKMWMAPDAPPEVTKGTARSSWIMDGRYVQEEFSGQFMGKPFRGVGLMGYDNVKQKYSNVWLDDMSTAMVITEGDAGEGGRVITFGGSYACAMTGEKNKAVKQVYRIVSRDKHIFEMYDPSRGQGESAKTMEITYTRN